MGKPACALTPPLGGVGWLALGRFGQSWRFEDVSREGDASRARRTRGGGRLRRSPKGTTENSPAIHGWVKAPKTSHPRCRRRRERASVSVFEARHTTDTPAPKCQRIFHAMRFYLSCGKIVSSSLPQSLSAIGDIPSVKRGKDLQECLEIHKGWRGFWGERN